MSAFHRRISHTELLLFVRVTPKSAKDAVGDVETRADGRSHVKMRVRAAPEDGRANAAVCRLAADFFDLPASAASLVGGQTSREKTLGLSGSPGNLDDGLARLGAV